jgi:hypothetical protein
VEGGWAKVKRRLLLGLGAATLLGVTVAAAFAWGYLAHRDRVFPYWVARSWMDRRELHPPWQKAVRPIDLKAAPAADLAALVELGYVESTFDADRDRRGVYQHVPGEAFEGLTLHFSRSSRGAALLDLSGKEVHRWVNEARLPWRYVELLAGGAIVVMDQAGSLAKRDRESRPLWRIEDSFHHRLSVTPEGNVLAIAHRVRVEPRIHSSIPILDDSVVVIDQDGRVVREHGLAELLLSSSLSFLVPSVGLGELDRGNALDVLHTNDVDFLDGDHPVWGGGNLLLSFRTPSLIVVTDPGVTEVLWAWGPGTLTYQHDPSFVAGNLLVFDNGLRRSRLLEIDPATFDVRWQYGPVEDFFTRTRGSAQRLPNGNTLVIESDTGYAFEVTAAGKEVWSFANPEIDDRGARESLWSMRRYSFEEVPWLDADRAPGPPSGS